MEGMGLCRGGTQGSVLKEQYAALESEQGSAAC